CGGSPRSRVPGTVPRGEGLSPKIKPRFRGVFQFKIQRSDLSSATLRNVATCDVRPSERNKRSDLSRRQLVTVYFLVTN
ncbi:hypothetical protein KKG85_00145, partial [Patescibacteria group bacterium]|nr:hypothetical protein [Patescibacteria group bacterium]